MMQEDARGGGPEDELSRQSEERIPKDNSRGINEGSKKSVPRRGFQEGIPRRGSKKGFHENISDEIISGAI